MSNIKRNGSTITWDAPFSLDLTGVDPDIVYCVEVYNITCGEFHPVFMNCNVVKDMITCSCEPSFIYEVLITPRSNANRSLNGTALAIKGNLKYLPIVCMHFKYLLTGFHPVGGTGGKLPPQTCAFN